MDKNCLFAKFKWGSLDHPTDTEFLNTPLEHYNYMQLCFAKSLSGGHAMAIGVPLGKLIVVEGKDKSKVMEGQGTTVEVTSPSLRGPGFGFIVQSDSYNNGEKEGADPRCEPLRPAMGHPAVGPCLAQRLSSMRHNGQHAPPSASR
ncbi:hypothetical protein D1007_40563 [Hordeum vulgare]|nr:hypothetical protein D1007_40563 [Hordeum vulgare]